MRADADGEITDIADAHDAGIWINGGYYMFRREIFDYIRGNEDLVEEPFTRLVAEDQLAAFRHDGFYVSMDTLKDLATLEALEEQGNPPWAPAGGRRRPARPERRSAGRWPQSRRRRLASSRPSASCSRMWAMRWNFGPSNSSRDSPTALYAA